MDLKDTIDLMISEDYQDRFRAEYYQLKIRRDKLADMLNKWRKGELQFEPKCSKAILAGQLVIMDSYLFRLKERAEIEDISL